MTPAERQEALQLVDDLQAERATHGMQLTAAEVPKILLPPQVRWHLDEAPVRIAEKGRRVGFTWGAWAAEAPLEAARQNGGMDQFYMGYNQGMAAEFIGDCATFARWYGLICSEIGVGFQEVVIADEKRDIVTYKITLANGRKIEALSSMPHNWRGRQGHARIDEAGHHQRLDAVIEGAMAYRIWGGRVSIGGTINGEDNPFTEYCKRVREGKLPWSHHLIRFSDAVREGLYQRICLITKKPWSPEAERAWVAEIRAQYADAESADQELECIPKRGTGAYFTRLLLEHASRPNVPIARYRQPATFVTDPERLAKTQAWLDAHVAPLLEALDPKRSHAFGQDFSRSADGDLSAITVAADRAGAVGLDTQFSIELRGIPYDCQQLVVWYVLDRLPHFRRACFDATGNGNSHAEAALQRYGSDKVECVMISASIHDLWWPKLRQAYEDREFTIERDEDVIADHRAVMLVNGQPRVSGTRRRGADGGARHGDAAIAKLLALMAALADRVMPAAGETVDAQDDVYAPTGFAAHPGGGIFGRLRRSLSLWGRPDRGGDTDEGVRARQGTPGHALDAIEAEEDA